MRYKAGIGQSYLVGIRTVVLTIDDPAKIERVVDGYESARAHELERLFIVSTIIYFISVDKGEFSETLPLLLEEICQRLGGIPDSGLDSIGDSCPLPVPFGDC